MLAWLRKLGGDKALHQTFGHGSAAAIAAWAAVVEVLPAPSRFALLAETSSERQAGQDADHCLATSIFNNAEPGAIEAWGHLLALVPDRNAERSQLLLARRDNAAGKPGLALLFERGDTPALDQFVDLAKMHIWHGNRHIHGVLRDCLPALDLLTAQRGEVCEGEAPDWVRVEELEIATPYPLPPAAQASAQAYLKLVRLAPETHRNDLLLAEKPWANFPAKNGEARHLRHDQARDLAHAITLLKAMAPAMRAEESQSILTAIRSRHATKNTIGLSRNTDNYKIFKKTWPVLDAILLDLKAELKAVSSS